MSEGARISITGVVQGVGFRPFVYNLAVKHGLAGWCLNDSEGVKIEVEGAHIEPFIEELRNSPPPLARITGLSVEKTAPAGLTGFSILRSARAASSLHAPVPVDAAVCGDCLAELFDKTDRRRFYPFINCTNCGPRYSIVTGVPYDRPNTTMARFTMCAACETEYKDPRDRRFHAQPNACAKCGPKAWLAARDGADTGAGFDFEAIKRAQRLIEDGAIIAVKGVGGFHLACDARNDGAVKRLRALKRTGRLVGETKKPFAVMARDLASVCRFALYDAQEQKILSGAARPIVLLEKRLDAGGADRLSEAVSPDNARHGAFLPYAPLYHLLFHGSAFDALVMTSGNAAEEPIVTSNDEAVERLSRLADFFILHDRDIYMRVDDSIVRVDEGRERVFRRARGYAPEAVLLDKEARFCADVLAFGAELKNTFCLGTGVGAVMSQHLGDMESAETLAFFDETLANLKRTYECAPSIIARDMHPDYLSTRRALEYARSNRIPDEMTVAVQHHHAHIASCMAEHGLTGPVIGVAFDGAGLGTDDAVWGGEFLAADKTGFKRAAHLRYVPMPGGDAASREPWRMALSHLHAAFEGDESGFRRAAGALFKRIGEKRAENVLKMIARRINSPLTSSAGRLFDAASSIAALRDFSTFEGEAAMRLEGSATGYTGKPSRYPFAISDGDPLVIDTAPLIRSLAEDAARGVEPSAIAAAFHEAAARIITETASIIREKTGINAVALSGGVFQNRLLTELATQGLSALGFEVYTNDAVPTNDAGISLGQAVVAWETVKGRL